MSFTNWLFETCGRNHIGMYTCSRCGYELLRSNIIEKNFVKSSSPSLSSILPPPTIAARDKIVKSQRFAQSMVEDFTKNFNLGRVLHKNSVIKERLGEENDTEKYELSCGKCGNLLGHQLIQMKRSSLQIKFDSVDLTFKPS